MLDSTVLSVANFCTEHNVMNWPSGDGWRVGIKKGAEMNYEIGTAQVITLEQFWQGALLTENWWATCSWV